MPIKLDIAAPQVADKLTLVNGADESVNVQVRVFRWSTVNGAEKLEPTTDVVASPPAARVPAKGQYVLRIVRVGKAPVAGEERYRVLINEIPDTKKMKAGTVGFALRFSVSIFFHSPNAADARVVWSVRQTLRGLVVSGANSGDVSLRITDLKVLSGRRLVASKSGLVGYVQGGATSDFQLGQVKGALRGNVQLKAQSDEGAIDVTIPISN
ncbi:MAG: fimbria/pilus periplasmic chaperone [Phyllobacterium sp.]|uniref:fimbrial biogenesis chaperone n=1 Tax=Phyllobacterium sp. TaxID=1871046 RepID=UPI0030F04390